VALKRWPVTGDRMTLAAWQLAIGAGCGGLGALLAGERGLIGPLTPEVLAALLFHIVLGTALAYWLWFKLSEQVDATVAALTTLAVPVVGVLGAMALVGDRPSSADWWGFTLVLGGAAAAMLRLRSAAPTEGR
ncbi:MAG: DMT family transporter, partial [Rubrivivax sp.]|nr:DMT family transporter [Rubrivivax sp.]